MQETPGPNIDEVSPATLGGRHKQSAKNILHVGKIYADWCGHCISLKPEWAKMKNDMKLALGRSIKNAHIQFVEIGDTPKNKSKGLTVDGMVTKYNNTTLKNSSDKLKSEGFPTIFKVLNGKLQYYTGKRDAGSMYSWFTQGLNKPEGKHMRGGSKTRSKKSKGILAKIKNVFETLPGLNMKNKSKKNKSRRRF
jgi:thiol-disulfide isomerase/thioredoxin